MSKRVAEDDHTKAFSKKQKIAEIQTPGDFREHIRSLQDLKACLAFDQDANSHVLRQNIRSFKKFLDSIAYGENEDDRSAKRRLLFELSRTQSPRGDTESAKYFSDLMQTWSFAAHSNSEGLFSAVAAVVALLLKVISGFIELREHGNRLCKTLLQEDQIRRFERGLSANQSKEHVISPCLRLLTEIVLFDGGTAAKELYGHRDVLFKRLDTFLSLRKESAEQLSEERHKPSVRNNALRYLFANLRLQDPRAKSYILLQKRIIRAVFNDIREDPPEIIIEILSTFEKCVIRDQALQVDKNQIFTDWTLGRIAALYQYRENSDGRETPTNIQALAHSFLLRLCTSVDYGILIIRTEVSPRMTIGPEHRDDRFAVAVAIDSETTQKCRMVKNITLALFLQGLRPYADVRQSDLIIAIFQAAPELIPDYFSKKKSFSIEPKLSVTWVGYSMFLLAAIRLPLYDEQFKTDFPKPGFVPPPLSIMMESIMPSSLSKKALTRCINQTTELINFFAVTILIAVFQKLAKALELLTAATYIHRDQLHHLCKTYLSELPAELSKRCPEMKHIIALFRRCPQERSLLREATSRLLAMYYRVLPQLAFEEKFDISVSISDIIQDGQSRSEDLNLLHLPAMEVTNLLEIAHRLPDMRWWHTSADRTLSPFTTVLKFCVTNLMTQSGIRLIELLQSAVEDTAIFQQRTAVSPLGVLVTSLQASNNWKPSERLFEFLNNCFFRVTKRPVKYYEDLMALSSSINPKSEGVEGRNVDLLLITISEQWQFLVKSVKAADLENAVRWLARYLGLSLQGGDNSLLLARIRDQAMQQTNDSSIRKILEDALEDNMQTGPRQETYHIEQSSQETLSHELAIPILHGLPTRVKPSFPQGPPPENGDLPNITGWIRKGIADVVSDEDISQLIFALCSMHKEVRLQGLCSLQVFLENLKASLYSERQQTYLLIGEVVETAKEVVLKSSLPYFAGAVAARCLIVLANPLHPLYAKVNRFLNRRPQWELAKLPSYWVDKILLNPPVDDDGHYQEVEWLLEVLTDGLRTPSDMELYRRCRILERLFSITESSFLPQICLEKIIELLCRCTYVGGSSTLITRYGLLSWICSQIKTGLRDHSILRQLAWRAYDTCDKERVDCWAGGTAITLLNTLDLQVGDSNPREGIAK